jgi:hypothetical protein
VPPQLEGLPDMKPEDMAFFGKLLQDAEEAELSVEEAKERKIMKLLLKVGRQGGSWRRGLSERVGGGGGGGGGGGAGGHRGGGGAGETRKRWGARPHLGGPPVCGVVWSSFVV